MTDRGPGFRPEPEGPEGPDQRDQRETGSGRGLPAADEEMLLRLLLRDTVAPIEPSPGALSRLRQAVPVRRRRRHFLAAAASVALLGFGVPLAVQSAASISSGGGGSAAAEEDRSTMGRSGALDGSGGGGSGDSDGERDASGQETEGASGEGPTEGRGTEPDDAATETLEVTSPDCTRDQFGGAETVAGEADAEGVIYGSFRLTNVSDQSCRVEGPGELSVLPFGSADASDVQILYRTEGDRASRLPTSEESYEELILAPGDTYEVQFAWVPDDSSGGCAVAETNGADSSSYESDETDSGSGSGTDASAGTSGDGTTMEQETGDSGGDSTGSTGSTDGSGSGTDGDDSSSSDGSGGTDDGSSSGASGDTGGGDGSGGDSGTGNGTGDSGITLQYTPAAGEPEAAEIVLTGACAGTIYRTGVLESSSG